MDIIQLSNHVNLIGIRSSSFPQGVEKAHELIKKVITPHGEPSFYGISYPSENGEIKYLAATNEGTDERITTELETFTIRKGAFLSIVVEDWPANVPRIQQVFDQLIADPRIDTNGYCLEEYITENTLRCMVPLADEFNPGLEREELIKDINDTFDYLYKTLAAFEDEAINTVPYQGSWTAGQVTEHIIKSIEGIPDSSTGPANRFHDQKVLPIRELFLNMNLKFKTDPFLAPAEPPHDIDQLFRTLEELQEQHRSTAENAPLEDLCLDMEFPTFGYLTRYEWLKFMMVHTQRHTEQIRNIYKLLAEKKPVK